MTHIVNVTIAISLIYTKFRDHNMIKYTMALICTSLIFHCFNMNIKDAKLDDVIGVNNDLAYDAYELSVTFLAAIINLIIFLMVVDIKYKFLLNIVATTLIILGVFFSIMTHFDMTLMNIILGILQIVGVILYILVAFYIILSI
jgi:hypothetical protein